MQEISHGDNRAAQARVDVRWSRRAKSFQALALRSKIVLACAGGADNKSVAGQVHCTQATVRKWRRRFVAQRLDGLVDEPRPGRPPSISAEQVEAIVVATLEETRAHRIPSGCARNPVLADR